MLSYNLLGGQGKISKGRVAASKPAHTALHLGGAWGSEGVHPCPALWKESPHPLPFEGVCFLKFLPGIQPARLTFHHGLFKNDPG